MKINKYFETTTWRMTQPTSSRAVEKRTALPLDFLITNPDENDGPYKKASEGANRGKPKEKKDP